MKPWGGDEHGVAVPGALIHFPSVISDSPPALPETPRGVELFKELVQRADVVAENFSVGTMERLFELRTGLGGPTAPGRSGAHTTPPAAAAGS